ncbi:MAG: hypothetical protein GXY64_07150 [Bacteroidales bacterium]|nr:hypothetical protein [Bacteroidales bacterium]
MKNIHIFITALFVLLTFSSCEKYKTYENGRLPYLVEIPTDWNMGESSPVLIKFYNADRSIVISCDIGELSLIRDYQFNEFYDYLYQKHEKNIYDKEAIVKTDSLYVLNWRKADNTYVIDGSKCMNGYLCGIQVTSNSKSKEKGKKVFERIFESIHPNPNFIAPQNHEEE